MKTKSEIIKTKDLEEFLKSEWLRAFYKLFNNFEEYIEHMKTGTKKCSKCGNIYFEIYAKNSDERRKYKKIYCR